MPLAGVPECAGALGRRRRPTYPSGSAGTMSLSFMSRNTPILGISPNGSGGAYGSGAGTPLPAGRAVDHGVEGGSGAAADGSELGDGAPQPDADAGGCGRMAPKSLLNPARPVPLAGWTGVAARVGYGAGWTRCGGAGGGVNGGVGIADPAERVGGMSMGGGAIGERGDAARAGGIGLASGDAAGRGSAGGGVAGGWVADDGIPGRDIADGGIPGRDMAIGGVAGRDVTDGVASGDAARGGGLAIAPPGGGTGIEPIGGRDTGGGASGGISKAGMTGDGAGGGDETTRETLRCPAPDASPGPAATVTVSLVAVNVGTGVRYSREAASRRISCCRPSMSDPRARVVSVRSRRSCPLTCSTRSLRSKATSPLNRAMCSLSAWSMSRRKVRSNCAWYSRNSRRGSGAVRIPTSLYTRDGS